jgi:hypothetical protein
VTSRNWGEREMGSCHSAVEIFSPARWLSSRGLLYNMVPTVNGTVFYS